MKKFEELSRDEKKVVEAEFKASAFGKYIFISELYNVISLIVLFLLLFTNIFSKMNIILSIIILVLFIGLGEFTFYKKKSLIKEYYELKNNDK